MRNIVILVLPLLIGYLLDLILGDPAWMPHPARVIGWFARALSSVVKWAFPRTEKGQLAAGALLALLVPVVSLLVPALLLAFAQTINTALWFALETMLCYQLVSTRGLHDAGMRVFSALNKEEHGDLSRARLALSRMTDLDTGSLNRQEVIKTTVGALADSVTGGVVAPLLFIAVGGGALGVFYRAVSVTASAVGRENEELGAAARTLRNLCDFIPMRLTAALMLFSARISGLDAKNALREYRRERQGYGRNRLAQVVCAAALGISLEGKSVDAREAGGGPRSAKPEDIRLVSRLMLFSSLFCVLLVCIIKLAVFSVIV